MENGGIMGRRLMSARLAYGPDIWIRMPITSSFKSDGTPRKEATSMLPAFPRAEDDDTGLVKMELPAAYKEVNIDSVKVKGVNSAAVLEA